jgi:hypothetical protein
MQPVSTNELACSQPWKKSKWIKVKLDEYYDVRSRPHPIEIAMYFDA